MTLKGFLKGIIYASLAIIPMLAWYVSDSTFFPYITGKNFGFRLLTEIAFVSWAILAVIDPVYRVRKSLVFYSYGAFLSLIFIADIFGSNPFLSFFSNYERMEGWFTHLHLFLYFLVLYSVYKTEKDWTKMFAWFSVGAIGVSVNGLIQLFGQKEFFLTKIYGATTTAFINSAYPVSMGNGLRLDSTLGNADYYGIYTLFFVCIAALMAFKTANWKKSEIFVGAKSYIAILIGVGMICLQPFLNLIANASGSASVYYFGSFIWFVGSIIFLWSGYYFAKNLSEGRISSWVFVAIGVVNFIELIYTQTRGSWFGFAGAFLTSALCIVFAGRKKYKKLARFAAVSILAIFAFFVLVFSFSDSKVVQNSIILRRIATIKVVNILFHPINSIELISDESNNYEVLKSHFGEATIVSRFLNMKMSIDGWSENTKTMLIGYGQENYSDVFAKHFDARMYDQEAWFDRAHDVFMDWLVAAGALGLIAYLSLYFTPFYMMWFGKGKSNIHIFEKSILTGTLVGYFVHNIFVFDNIVSYIIFVSLLAYIAARTRASDGEIKQEEKSKTNISDWLMYSLISLAIAFGITLSVYTVFRPLNQNLALIETFRSNPTSTKDLVEKTTQILNTYQQVLSINSFGITEAREQMLQAVIRLAQIDQSTELEEDVRAPYLKVLSEFDTFARAEYTKELADNYTARNTSIYGSYLRQVGDTNGALDIFAKANAISPKKQTITFEYINLLILTGNTQKAYELAKVAYYSDTGFATAREVFIIASAMNGNYKEALDEVNKIKEKDADYAKRLEDQVKSIMAQDAASAKKK